MNKLWITLVLVCFATLAVAEDGALLADVVNATSWQEDDQGWRLERADGSTVTAVATAYGYLLQENGRTLIRASRDGDGWSLQYTDGRRVEILRISDTEYEINSGSHRHRLTLRSDGSTYRSYDR